MSLCALIYHNMKEIGNPDDWNKISYLGPVSDALFLWIVKNNKEQYPRPFYFKPSKILFLALNETVSLLLLIFWAGKNPFKPRILLMIWAYTKNKTKKPS